MGRLQIEGLRIAYTTEETTIQAVEGIDLRLEPGRALGIVGGSGSGKSSLALALMRLLPSNGRIVGGRIRWDEHDLLAMSEESFRVRMRWKEIAMVFQGSSQPFNPVLRMGEQIVETIRQHRSVSVGAAQGEAADLFQRVGLPTDCLRSFPHQLSGGMRQRAAIALALCAQPRLLIADEPTSALDVLVQAQILRLLTDLRRERGLSLLLISHDLSVVAQACEDVVVLQGGKVVECGPVERLFHRPDHPYTRSLVAALPSLHPLPSETPKGPSATPTFTWAEGRIASSRTARGGSPQPAPEVVAEAHQLHKEFSLPGAWGFRRRVIRAVAGVDLQLRRGEVLGLVGESGSGKTTVARLLMGLELPTRGRVTMAGRDLHALASRQLREHRSRFQMIMQDPYDSMNPLMDVFTVVAEPLRVQRKLHEAAQLDAHVRRALAAAELSPPEAFLQRPIRALSGGEQQRVAIARALILEPSVLIADEPVSMLDASTRADIVRLLLHLVRVRSLGLLFITHDLALARHICDRIAVMYGGVIVEEGSGASLLRRPHHPYTQALLDAVPTLGGATPAAPDPPGDACAQESGRESGQDGGRRGDEGGCPVAARCPLAAPLCRNVLPPRVTLGDGHWVACHRPDEAAEAYLRRTALGGKTGWRQE